MFRIAIVASLMLAGLACGAVYNNLGNVKVDDVQYSATAATSTRKTFPNYSTLQTIGRGGIGGIAINDIVAKGPKIDARHPSFANLSGCIHAVSATGGTVVVSTPMAINNKTRPTNVEIEIVKGGSISPASGKVFDWNGTTPVAGNYQIFAGSGTHTGLKEARPEWFGADATGVINAATPFLKALTAAPVFITSPGNTYYLSTAVAVPVTVRKIGGGGAIVVGNNHGLSFTGVVAGQSTVSTILDTIDTSNAAYSDFSTRITVDDVAPFAVGQTVRLFGDAAQSLFATITKITDDVVTLDKKLTFTIGTNPVLSVYTGHNCEVTGITFSHLNRIQTAYAINIVRSSGVSVRQCKFSGTNTLSISNTGFNNILDGNTFDGVKWAILNYDSGPCTITKNRIYRSEHGIRNVRCHGLLIDGNQIYDGSNQPFGIGIELTGELGTYDKNCWNVVSNNTVINANHGIPGSGIGGIHLNFKANYNTVVGNISQRNSFGIYLENLNSHNIIQGNNCSYNDGYYGVGIELDWSNHYNTVTGNTCNYNRGALNAAESSGIQIRAPKNDDHTQIGNTITGNVCNYNGMEGIRANGEDMIVSGNSLRDNGQDMVEVFNKARGIYVNAKRTTVSNNTISQNAYDSRATSLFVQRGIDVVDSEDVAILGNQINIGYFGKHAISVTNTDGGVGQNIDIKHNTIYYRGAYDTVMYVVGFSAAQPMLNIYIESNTLDNNNTGRPHVSVNYIDGFTLFNNKYINYKSISVPGTALNRVTPGND